MKALLLGMSISGGCMTHCGSVFLPILLCERQNRWRLTGIFFGTRMLGYLCFALISFYLGNLFNEWGIMSQYSLKGIVTLCMAFAIGYYSWNLYKRQSCENNCSKPSSKWGFKQFKNHSHSYAARAGFMTGISFCAPFWLVFTESIQQTTLLNSISVFVLFYTGTSILFLPLFLCGWIRPNRSVQQIGLLASICITLIYFLQGISTLLGAFYETI